MITASRLTRALSSLAIDRASPVIAHASLSAFGQVEGGAQTLVEALLRCFDKLIMPCFTYKTMLVPEQGPPDNGMTYGANPGANLMAEFFRPEMPADRLIGAVAEALRRHPRALRSPHPILSFVGVNAGRFLASQTLAEPLAPIRHLAQEDGWVLLLGVNHTVNTSIHLAERLAGRVQFVRWALTPDGVVECPAFPGCSDGFESLAPHLVSVTRQVRLGQARIQALPLRDMIAIAKSRIDADPCAFLCKYTYCERCQEIYFLARNGDSNKPQNNPIIF
jgi:aminoglycoside 3-N-acetyltransferase